MLWFFKVNAPHFFTTASIWALWQMQNVGSLGRGEQILNSSRGEAACTYFPGWPELSYLAVYTPVSLSGIWSREQKDNSITLVAFCQRFNEVIWKKCLEDYLMGTKHLSDIIIYSKFRRKTLGAQGPDSWSTFLMNVSSLCWISSCGIYKISKTFEFYFEAVLKLRSWFYLIIFFSVEKILTKWFSAG